MKETCVFLNRRAAAYLNNTMKRINLTAFLSDDDGLTWSDGLLLDSRADVSYPDGVEVEPGRWIVVYDRERNDQRVSKPDKVGAAEILLADFTEDDVINGALVNDRSRVRVTVNKLH